MLIESPRVSNQLQACCLPGREHQDSGHMACVKLFVGSSSAQWAVQCLSSFGETMSLFSGTASTPHVRAGP